MPCGMGCYGTAGVEARGEDGAWLWGALSTRPSRSVLLLLVGTGVHDVYG